MKLLRRCLACANVCVCVCFGEQVRRSERIFCIIQLWPLYRGDVMRAQGRARLVIAKASLRAQRGRIKRNIGVASDESDVCILPFTLTIFNLYNKSDDILFKL